MGPDKLLWYADRKRKTPHGQAAQDVEGNGQAWRKPGCGGRLDWQGERREPDFDQHDRAPASRRGLESDSSEKRSE
ncbi:hypothetical protein [Pseudomonas sp.]|uniref:hypothetical protein n=1 Tax=Pseudomonas sp. TaxID=306 RepID=UPI0028B04908|nr:hypothetical protein [Pseudomonas sp.]